MQGWQLHQHAPGGLILGGGGGDALGDGVDVLQGPLEGAWLPVPATPLTSHRPGRPHG